MKVLDILGITFFGIGAVLLLVALVTWRSSAGFVAYASSADGTVVGLVRGSSRGGSKPRVEFTTEAGRGVRFDGRIGSSPPAYAEGEHVRVLYDPADPTSARIDSRLELWFLPLLFGGLGAIFAAIGGGFLAYIVRKRRLRAWLAVNGERVNAKFAGVHYDTRLKINGRHPWRLTCQWQHPLTQKVYLFRSDAIWFDPTPFVDRDQLDVLVNSANPKQYVVDTQFLPDRA